MSDDRTPDDVDEIEEEAAEIDARDPDAAEEVADLVQTTDLTSMTPPPDVEI